MPDTFHLNPPFLPRLYESPFGFTINLDEIVMIRNPYYTSEYTTPKIVFDITTKSGPIQIVWPVTYRNSGGGSQFKPELVIDVVDNFKTKQTRNYTKLENGDVPVEMEIVNSYFQELIRCWRGI